MAERPEPPTDETASYSPPPSHRPGWIGGGWGDATPPPPDRGVTGGWSGPAGATGIPEPSRPPRRGNSLGVVATVAVLAAAISASGTYGLLLAGGHLDRRVAINDLISQQAAAQTTVDPDVVRVVEVEETAITRAVDRVSPAVVTITPTGRSNGFSFPEGIGSGVIFDQDGWVVTNRHVVCSSDTLSVQLADGRRYDGTIHGLDTLTDLAIVKIDAEGLPAVTIGNSDVLKVGQLAVAIGSPLGTFTNSVTTGVVSAIGRDIDVNDACSRRPETLITSSRPMPPSTRAIPAERWSIRPVS